MPPRDVAVIGERARRAGRAALVLFSRASLLSPSSPCPGPASPTRVDADTHGRRPGADAADRKLRGEPGRELPFVVTPSLNSRRFIF